jgi:hypothetical protein
VDAAAAPGEGKDEEEKKDGTDGNEEVEDSNEWINKGWKRNYNKLQVQDKISMLVDEVFALYLYTVSKKVNDTFYRTILAFVILFRECLNEIGWRKLQENEADQYPDIEEKEKQEFCLVNSAEHGPEISNEFVTIYMEKKKGLIEIIKCE